MSSHGSWSGFQHHQSDDDVQALSIKLVLYRAVPTTRYRCLYGGLTSAERSLSDALCSSHDIQVDCLQDELKHHAFLWTPA